MPGAKQRAVLAALLLAHRDGVVSAERLIDELWGDDPPATAAKSLQVHVSQLRRLLGDGQPIVTRPTGYAIELAPGALDLERFERRLDDARRLRAAGDLARRRRRAARRPRAVPRRAARRRRAARALVGRGQPGCEGVRLSALEDRVELDLALGEHAAVIAELEGARRRAPVPRAAARAPDARALPRRPPGRRARRLPPRPDRPGGGARHRARAGAAAARGGVLNQDAGARPERARRDRAAAPRTGAEPARARDRPRRPRRRARRRLRAAARAPARRRSSARAASARHGSRSSSPTGSRGEFRDGARFVALAAIDARDRLEAELAQAVDDGGTERLLVLDNFEQLVDAAPAVGDLLARAPGRDGPGDEPGRAAARRRARGRARAAGRRAGRRAVRRPRPRRRPRRPGGRGAVRAGSTGCRWRSSWPPRARGC